MSAQDPITRDEQRKWNEQWSHYQPELDVERPLLERWMRPLALDEVRGLDVLDVGCGNGSHTAILALAGARTVRGVDYASWREASERFGAMPGVSFGFHDITASPPEGQYDLVVCVGVLPHVDDPRRGVANLAAAVKPGGRLLIWATVREGNEVLMAFDAAKVAVTKVGGRRAKEAVAKTLALASRPAQLVASRSNIAREVLPYGRYLAGLASLPVSRVEQNFYDALNAPRRVMFREHEVTGWMRDAGLDVSVRVCDDAKSRTWIGRRPAGG